MIREGEQPILPPDDLGWLDEGIRRSDESGGGDDGGDGSDGDDGGYRGDGGNDEETHGVGGRRGGAMTWDSEYYATRDTDHEGRAGFSQ